MGSESMEIIHLDDVPNNFTGIAKDPDGLQYWFQNGELHREDGPAIIYPDGTQELLRFILMVHNNGILMGNVIEKMALLSSGMMADRNGILKDLE